MSNHIEVTLEHFAETSANARFHRTAEFSGVLDGIVITVKSEDLPAQAETEATQAAQEETDAASSDSETEAEERSSGDPA